MEEVLLKLGSIKCYNHSPRCLSRGRNLRSECVILALEMLDWHSFLTFSALKENADFKILVVFPYP